MKYWIIFLLVSRISAKPLSPCDPVDIAERHLLLLASSFESKGGEEAVEVPLLHVIFSVTHHCNFLLDIIEVVNVHIWSIFSCLRPGFVGKQLLFIVFI